MLDLAAGVARIGAAVVGLFFLAATRVPFVLAPLDTSREAQVVAPPAALFAALVDTRKAGGHIALIAPRVTTAPRAVQAPRKTFAPWDTFAPLAVPTP